MKKLMLLVMLVLGFAVTSLAQQQDTTLAQYVGKYVFPAGSVVPDVTVTLENGALVMSSSAGSSALDKESEDVYVIVAFQGKAMFKRDTNKKIVGISINAMGYQLEGTKENGIVIATNHIIR
ncbi:DUF3471 domain-containing protein [Parasediminibacterium paludis]|uniref:DUF3471 domain-containing protein n=1 Tax=Parasediminibacterium paludis TaxID=908966 RepID=A0ABV8PZV0_9BACT